MKSTFEVVLGDITTFRVDAIVNAAKESLLGGGGVDGAIHAAAGPELLEECRSLGGCPTGQARITKGYRLPCRHVIHAVGPRVMGYEPTDEDRQLLRSAYRSSLILANSYGLSTIAFSSISTGHYSFAPALAAPIAVNEILSFLNGPENTSIEKVIMVCFTQDVKDAFDLAVSGRTTPAALPERPMYPSNSRKQSIPKSLPGGILLVLLFSGAFNVYRGISAGFHGFALFSYVLCDLLSSASTISFCLTLISMFLAHKEGSKKKALIGIALFFLGIALLGVGALLKHHFGF